MNNIKIGDLIYIRPFCNKVDTGINYDVPVMVISRRGIVNDKLTKSKYVYSIVGFNRDNSSKLSFGFCIDEEYVKHYSLDGLTKVYKTKYQKAWFSAHYLIGDCVLFKVSDAKYNVQDVTIGFILQGEEDSYIIEYVDDNNEYRKFLIPKTAVICRNWDYDSIITNDKLISSCKNQKIKEQEKLKNKNYLETEFFSSLYRFNYGPVDADYYMDNPVLGYAEFYNKWKEYPSLCIADVYDATNNGLIEKDAIIIIDDDKENRTNNASQVKDEDIIYTCEDEISLFNLCKRHNGEDFFIKITRYE